MEIFHKITTALIISLILNISILKIVYAHPGGGPPFLKVNDEYAQTNPYFIGFPSFIIPMDVITKNVVINEQVQFDIDISTIGIPQDILTQSKIRWQFEGPQSPYQYGVNTTHTFSKLGSYIVTLEIQGPNETQFIVLDSVQIDVVPLKEYKTPTIEIITDKSSFNPDKEITFKANTTKDNTATINEITWEIIGDKKISGDRLTTKFTRPNTTQQIFAKVIDSNGLTSHAALYATHTGASIELKFPTPLIKTTQKTNFPSIPLSIIVVITVIAGILIKK